MKLKDFFVIKTGKVFHTLCMADWLSQIIDNGYQESSRF